MPVGMHMDTHNNKGSIQSVPSTCTTEWDMEKLTMSNSPARTAVAGMLIAAPTWWQAYGKADMHDDLAIPTMITTYSWL